MNYDELARKAGVVSPAAGQVDYDALAARAMTSPAPAAPESPFQGMQTAGRVVRDAMAGVVRGAGSIGATVMAPFDAAARSVGIENSFIGRTDRRQAMDQALTDNVGADTSSLAYRGGKLATEVAGTMGVGGALANGVARLAPRAAAAAPNVMASIRSMGMEAGPFAQGFVRRQATRALGGATGGGASTLMVEGPDAPASVGTGAALGAVTPVVLSGMAKLGKFVGGAARNMRDAGATTRLRETLDMTDSEIEQLIKYAKSAPYELMPGSPLTLVQALQYVMPKGAPQQIKMLDRVVSGGPGGAKLAQRVTDQNSARLQALEAQGASTYPGATALEAEATGNRLGATLRTQYEDAGASMRDRNTAQQARAKVENVRYQIPELEMAETTGPLGPGYTQGRAEVDKLLNEGSNLRNNANGDAVPFEEFQRLRQSAGTASAALAEDTKGQVQAGVANQIRLALERRADEAAAGNTLRGENVPAGFAKAYRDNRAADRKFFTDYESPDNIGAILKKGFGQQYGKDGNEVLAKIWHGGQGLSEDVARFRDVLSPTNQGPAMRALQEYVLTEAAGRTTAGGMLSAQFIKGVESRMPGFQQALTPTQLKALQQVVDDTRNAIRAADMPAVRGSDTQAKQSNAARGGLLGALAIEGATQLVPGNLGMVAVGRRAVVDAVKSFNGRAMAELLADPQLAVKALESPAFVKTLSAPAKLKLQRVAQLATTAPVFAATSDQ